ncbi:peptidase U32 [Candidatus Parcubacteria bacterium]|nr:MAG: peptidase U32 [Candidatus Parcubacteria bacterium]
MGFATEPQNDKNQHISTIYFMKLELLSPAGNIEKMKTALSFGATAVYAGIPDFSLRVRINDFDFEKIKEASEYCHSLGKKIYITTNIFAHNKHLEKIEDYILKLKEINIDAFIVSDPGIMATIKKVWPEAEIHLSTQANCTNWQSAKFWYESGVNRVVLGREVTLDEIKEIKEKVPELELEYFAHGAMCMAYSGRCFLSKMYLDRSGNLGDCVQPCRWEYTAHNTQHITHNKDQASLDIQALRHDEVLELHEEEHGSYILNSKDLCLVEHLQELAEVGVTSFKIEGRAKSAYYQAMVTGIYAQALQGIEKEEKVDIEHLRDELETKLVHRGYTRGFLLGEKADQNLEVSHTSCQWEYCGQILKKTENRKQTTENSPLFKGSTPKGGGVQERDKSAHNTVIVKVHNSIKLGDEVEIVRPMYDIIKMKVEKMYEPDTGEEITEAHGGQERAVLLEVPEEVPEWSVLRRKI